MGISAFIPRIYNSIVTLYASGLASYKRLSPAVTGKERGMPKC